MTKAAQSPRKNACTTAILIDELDTGGFNSSVFPWFELDDQFRRSDAGSPRQHTPIFGSQKIEVRPLPWFSLNRMPEDSSSLRPWAWSSREIGFVSQKRRT
jgi:hypothetical protein